MAGKHVFLGLGLFLSLFQSADMPLLFNAGFSRKEIARWRQAEEKSVSEATPCPQAELRSYPPRGRRRAGAQQRLSDCVGDRRWYHDQPVGFGRGGVFSHLSARHAAPFLIRKIWASSLGISGRDLGGCSCLLNTITTFAIMRPDLAFAECMFVWGVVLTANVVGAFCRRGCCF